MQFEYILSALRQCKVYVLDFFSWLRYLNYKRIGSNFNFEHPKLFYSKLLLITHIENKKEIKMWN